MAKKYINPNLKKKTFQASLTSIPELTEKLIRGDRSALSTAITIIESEKSSDRILSSEILKRISKVETKSLRIAISGSPGVGKSSFIEALAKSEPECPIAVLAVDPSSSQSHGSILGDKTRMESLVTRENAFIRPSPAGKTLGGVTAKTREVILLCEAAGFEKILVETVGVGQSETAVSNMVDFFLLLILPGSGDEVQGIKRGIVELADMVLITKNDGDRLDLARESMRAYKNAMHLFRQKYKNWNIPVFRCSSMEAQGLEKVWEQIALFEAFAGTNGWLGHHRRNQHLKWYEESLMLRAMELFESSNNFQGLVEQHKSLINAGEKDIWKLLNEF